MKKSTDVKEQDPVVTARELLEKYEKERMQECAVELQEVLKKYSAEIRVSLTLAENTIVPALYIHLL